MANLKPFVTKIQSDEELGENKFGKFAALRGSLAIRQIIKRNWPVLLNKPSQYEQ